jgi:hypothetical protein
MGYTTSFDGKFDLDKPLDDQTFEFLTKLATTRRMKRRISLLPKNGFEKYGFDSWGIEGEFYVDGGGLAGQDHDKSVVDYNFQPETQPGLWCQWMPTEDRCSIVWDGVEKFYEYEVWLKYIIDKVLSPRGYVLSGLVNWQGEEPSDFGQIKVENNQVYMRFGQRQYGEWK